MSKYCQDIVAFNICHNIITWIKNLIETQIIYWKCYQEKTSPQWRINWIQLVILSNLPKVRKINSKGWGLWTLERFTSFFFIVVSFQSQTRERRAREKLDLSFIPSYSRPHCINYSRIWDFSVQQIQDFPFFWKPLTIFAKKPHRRCSTWF